MAIVDRVYARITRALVGVGLIVRTGVASVLASDPTVSAGSGAPSATEPNGSLWLRTDGPPAYRGGSAWRTIGARVYSNTAAGSALTNSTSETVLGSATLPASSLVAGAVLRFQALVKVTANNSTTTLTVRVRLGGTTLTGTALVASTATDTAANNILLVQGELVARAAPAASAAIVGSGWFSEPAAAGGAAKSWSLDAANFATNAALLLEVTGQWSAADANSCQLEHLTVHLS